MPPAYGHLFSEREDPAVYRGQSSGENEPGNCLAEIRGGIRPIGLDRGKTGALDGSKRW